MTKRVLAAIILAAVTGFTAGQFARVDFYPGISTYGVSVGTDSSYCSFEEIGWPPFPAVSCETAS